MLKIRAKKLWAKRGGIGGKRVKEKHANEKENNLQKT